MSERNPMETNPSKIPPGGRNLRCEDWELLITDAIDGTLAAGDALAFEQHCQECASCAQLFAESRQGVAWLGFLDDEPEMAPDLMARILIRTSGTAAANTVPAPAGGVYSSAKLVPVWRSVAPVARRLLEPRLMMTAAMAFFSIALTLNLAGVRLSDVRLSDLRPSVLGANASRQYYAVKAQGVKYYDNLRFVYEMEARVRELRRSTESEPAPPPPPQRQSPSSRNPNDNRRSPDSRAGSSHPRGESEPASSEPDLGEAEVLVTETLRGNPHPQANQQPRAHKSQNILRAEDCFPALWSAPLHAIARRSRRIRLATKVERSLA